MPFAQAPGPGAYASLRDVRHESFWLAQPDRPAARAPAEGALEADLVVVGAGLSGLWTALRAKERTPELDVVLLEGDRIANAASGRNGGFLASSITHGYINGLQRWPHEFPTLYRLGLANFDEIAATIERYGIDCDFTAAGELDVATEPYQLEGLVEHRDHLSAAGVTLDLLDSEQTRALVNSPTYLGGLLDPHVGLVDPARLSWGLAEAAESLGVRIFEHTEVTGIERAGASLRLSTLGATLTTPRVALTTAAHQPLLRRISAYVVPVFDHVVMTAPLPPEVSEQIGWQGRQGVGDSGNQFHYYRLTADDRILWGGYDAVYKKGERPGSSLERDDFLTARLVQHLHDTFPQVAEVPIEYAWAGAIDTCSRFSAFWGQAYSGQLAYVAGFTGLGVGASRFGADVLLDLLLGERTERTELDMVGSKPLPFPPEPARQVVIDLTRRAISAADAQQGRRNLWLRTLDRLGLGFDS
ncbi:MAG: FAD-dependent oxidoreductase [Actinobacteria bacterium]|nr:FAD-dependent oxidoreductase [Actinomycetota bacterium]